MARTDTLSNFLTDVADAIRDKTGETGDIVASEFDTKIANFNSGNSGSEFIDGDYLVQFIGYRGEVLQTGKYYTGDVISFPEDPSYDGLTFQGWSSPVSYSNNQVTVLNQNLTIGTMFDTESGKTELDITLTAVTGLSVTLQNITGFTLIDWGDGETDTELGTHEYANAGDYTILISGSNMVFGSFIFGQSTSSYICTDARLSNISTIGASAFRYCVSLKNLTMSSSLSSLGEYAFQYCSALTNVIIPTGVVDITASLFYNDYSLKTIVIPATVETIAGSAFYNCYSVDNMGISENLETIGTYGLQNCTSLGKGMIPNTMTEIGNYSFRYNTSILEWNLTDFSSTDTPPTLGTTVFANINGACKIYFRDQATLDIFANATNWVAYADYMYVKEGVS